MFKWSRLLRRRVVVTMKSGRSITGVFYERRGSFLFLKDAQVFDRDARLDQGAAADGTIVVDFADVDFMQLPTRGSG